MRKTTMLLFVIAVVLVVAHTTSYTRLGPIDELQHVDYVDKIETARPT